MVGQAGRRSLAEAGRMINARGFCAPLPERVYQGKPASITVTTAAGPMTAAASRAQWTRSLPLTTPVGPAVASVSCGGSAQISRRFTSGA
jgi:hypothetical protein